MPPQLCPPPRGSPQLLRVTPTSPDQPSLPLSRPPPHMGGRSCFPPLPPLTPRPLLQRHSLPIAAHLHTPTPPPPGLDPKTPILLYRTSHSTKVRAVSLKTNHSGAIIATGPTLVIPEEYNGWFSVVTGRCKGASCLTTMQEVADRNLTFFLTRHDIPSYVRLTDQSTSGNTRYRRSVVPAGHVLKLLGLFEDAKRAERGQEGERGQGGDRFAQCLDHRGQVVFVPLSAKGKFYATADRSPALRSLDQVYLMSQLLEGFQLPITVRLVCGYMARVPSSFTGLLRLEGARREHVVLACTMTPDSSATFLEMDVDSSFLLTPVTDSVFPKTPLFLKTKSYCEDQAEAWQRQIKVTHHVTERRPLQQPLRSSPHPSLSDGVSSTGLLPPVDLANITKKTKHTRGLRELKARDRSRESAQRGEGDASRDSRADRSRDKSKARDKSRDGWHRDKSKESKLRIRIREKSRDRLTIRNGVATSFDILREKSNHQECVSSVSDVLQKKPEVKVAEARKLSKQNTYIFQNGRNTKYQEKKKESSPTSPPVPEHSLSYRLHQSADSQDYATVLDDISPLRRTSNTSEEDEDCHYAEICDNIYSTTVLSSSSDQDSMGSSCHRLNRTHKRDRLTSSHNWSFGTGTGSSSDDNHYSFTLLRQDVGQSFVKLAGFSAGDIVPKRHFMASSKHAYRPRSPASSQC